MLFRSTKTIAYHGLGTGAYKVILPNSVTTLGERAFEGNYSLKEINIPQSVTSIGYCAFLNTNSLERIDAYVDPANVTLGDDAIIMGMPQLENYYEKFYYGRCFYFIGSSNHGMDDCELHVLPGKEESFANAWSWARFKHIVGDLGAGIPGDVNGDGVVTAADITELYNFMLNNDDSHIVNGDINGDGNITAADITAVYGVLLGSTSPAPTQQPTPEPAPSPAVKVGPIPSSDYIMASAPSYIMGVELYDMSGNLVARNGGNYMNVGSMRDGHYILKVYTGNEISTHHVAVKH